MPRKRPNMGGGGIDIDLVGDKALKAVIDDLVPASRNRVVRRPMQKAMRLISKDAKRRVPVRTRALKQAIITKLSQGKKRYGSGKYRGAGTVAMVGVGHNLEKKGKIPNLYSQRVHWGHKYRSQAAATRRSKGRDYPKWQRADIPKRAVGGPNGLSTPFLLDAVDAQGRAAIELVRRELPAALAKEVAKLRAKHAAKEKL